MSKTRVYELAKELGLNTKKLIETLENDFKIEVKSHMSTLEEDVIETIKELYSDTGKKEAADKQKKIKKSGEDTVKKPNESYEIKKEQVPEEPKKEVRKDDEIKEITISYSDLKLDKLCEKMGKKQNDIIRDMFMKGKILRPGQSMSTEEAEVLALSYNFILNFIQEESVKESDSQNPEEILVERWKNTYLKKNEFKIRPPVVTVMGHVDHGKTTLLDAIRHTKVAEKEEGGITQSIGAYQTEYNGRKITFIDTPGHEAFTEMRARGAQATDIVVLIVAADDGVMPQTIEAYNHAKDANVPIIVAINKIDKPNANVELTKQQIVNKLNLIPEDWGGDTITVEISAKSGKGLEDLLEMILLVSEMQEINCYPKGNARGIIIESKLDKFLGPVATVIIKDGVLKQGDFFLAGSTHGKVRRMLDSNGKTIKKAPPSTPVQILGFEEVPSMHSVFYALDTLDEARNFSSINKEAFNKLNQKQSKKHMRLEDLMQLMEGDEKKKLNIIIKAGTFGEIEALKTSINKLKNDDVDIEVVHAGIGAVTTSDIMLATASNAVILGFRVKADSKTLQAADKEGIQVKRYDIIFNLIDEIKKALQGMLEPEEKEERIGSGEIKEVFKIKKIGAISGIQLNDGFVVKDGFVKIYRNSSLLTTVNIETLQHYKDQVKRVDAPKECGIKFENFSDISVGDELEFYRYIQVERTIEFKK